MAMMYPDQGVTRTVSATKKALGHIVFSLETFLTDLSR